VSTIEKHRSRLASVGCVACRRLTGQVTPAILHHVATGSSKRDPWALVPLCPGHHIGTFSIHKSPQAFLRVLKVPGETEWGLLAWAIEDLARFG